jgi:hypothetical protein
MIVYEWYVKFQLSLSEYEVQTLFIVLWKDAFIARICNLYVTIAPWVPPSTGKHWESGFERKEFGLTDLTRVYASAMQCIADLNVRQSESTSTGPIPGHYCIEWQRVFVCEEVPEKYSRSRWWRASVPIETEAFTFSYYCCHSYLSVVEWGRVCALLGYRCRWKICLRRAEPQSENRQLITRARVVHNCPYWSVNWPTDRSIDRAAENFRSRCDNIDY